MSVVEWLLDSDPAIHWQMMRDLTDEPEAAVSPSARGSPPKDGGARLLESQTADRQWGASSYTRYIDNPDGKALHALIKLFGDGAEVWVRMQAAYDVWHAARAVDLSRIPTLVAA